MTDTSTIILTPSPLTPLIGRDVELASLLKILRSGDRLVTITAIGGIGKTRLAHQAALELEPELAAGSLVVPLAEIRDAALIPLEIAKVLRHSGPILDMPQIASMLGNDSRLLVLDNLEQIPYAGDAIVELMQLCPNLTVLGTSQVPLDVDGEQRFPLEPMEIGDGSAEMSPAVELFLHRARAVDPRLEFNDSDRKLVAEICELLDGIPLAIELAASRLSIFSLHDLRERLTQRLTVLGRSGDGRDQRHHTMRNAIAWSYDLMDADQQRLFRYLGVFVGGISIRGIEHTQSMLEIARDPLDTISTLADRGLIRRMTLPDGVIRYQMLQTLREFAEEQLLADGDYLPARLAHATHVLAFAEEAEPHLQGEHQTQWFRELRASSANVRAACEWSATHRPEITLRIIAAIWRAIDQHGRSQPFVDLGQKALEVVDDTSILMRGWLAVGSLEVRQRDKLADAEVSLQNALELARASNNRSVEARALTGIGTVALHLGQFDEAERHFTEAVHVANRTGDPTALYPPKGNLGLIAFYRQEYDDALEQLEDTLVLIEQTGDRSAIAHMYGNLGTVLNRREDYLLAKDYLERAVEISRELDNAPVLHHALFSLGNTYIRLKDFDASRASFDEAAQVANRSHLKVSELEARVAQGQIYMDQNDSLSLLSHLRESLQITSVEAAAPAIRSAAGAIMAVCLEHGKRQEAAYLAGAVLEDDLEINKLHPYTREAGLALIQSIPDDPAHPERIALETGKTWSTQTLSQKAKQFAHEIIVQEPGAGPALPVLQQPTVLTPRELEVLGLMSKGHSNQEIADQMFISLRTITTHASNIFTKLGVKNRAAAVALALNAGLL